MICDIVGTLQLGKHRESRSKGCQIWGYLSERCKASRFAVPWVDRSRTIHNDFIAVPTISTFIFAPFQRALIHRSKLKTPAENDNCRSDWFVLTPGLATSLAKLTMLAKGGRCHAISSGACTLRSSFFPVGCTPLRKPRAGSIKTPRAGNTAIVRTEVTVGQFRVFAQAVDLRTAVTSCR